MTDGSTVVDKPAGWTSHDVVAKCRGIFGQKRVVNGVEERGYGIMIGGGLSSSPKLAKRLPVFIKPEQGWPVIEAVSKIFRDEGYRLKRREGQRPEIQGGKLPVVREEPLKRELADFVQAVRNKRRPLVSGEDGLRALKLAQAIAEKMETV